MVPKLQSLGNRSEFVGLRILQFSQCSMHESLGQSLCQAAGILAIILVMVVLPLFSKGTVSQRRVVDRGGW